MGLSAGLFLPTTWLSDLGALSYVGIMGMLSAFGLTGEQTWVCDQPALRMSPGEGSRLALWACSQPWPDM